MGENFVYDNDSVNNIITLTCIKNLEHLKEANTMCVENAFKNCPKQFFQLFSTFIKIGNFYAPAVLTLLPNKTTESYMLVFRKITEYVKVDTVFTDF